MPRLQDPAILAAIRAVPGFGTLDEGVLAILAEGARIQHLARNDMLVHCGDPASALYVVQRGELRHALLAASGAEKIVRITGPGESFGEEAVLTGRAHMVSSQAMRETSVVLIGLAAVRRAMAASRALAESLAELLSLRMYALMENMQTCVQRNSTQRVAHYLAALAPANAEHCEVELATDKQTIAAQLNLTPETLSRVLSRFTRDGWILPRGRHRLALADVANLRLCAG